MQLHYLILYKYILLISQIARLSNVVTIFYILYYIIYYIFRFIYIYIFIYFENISSRTNFPKDELYINIITLFNTIQIYFTYLSNCMSF